MLDEPEDGASITDNDTVVLRWHWTEPLRPDDHFDVLVWREGNDRGSVAWTREPVYHLHIPTQDDRLTMPELKGAYYWSIVVVHGQTAADRKVVSVESNTNIFIWKGHTGGDDEGP